MPGSTWRFGGVVPRPPPPTLPLPPISAFSVHFCSLSAAVPTCPGVPPAGSCGASPTEAGGRWSPAGYRSARGLARGSPAGRDGHHHTPGLQPSFPANPQTLQLLVGKLPHPSSCCLPPFSRVFRRPVRLRSVLPELVVTLSNCFISPKSFCHPY